MSNEEFQALILEKLDLLENSLGGVKTDLADVKTDLADVKTDLADVKTDLADVKTDLADVKTDLGDVKTDLADVKTKLDAVYEQTAVLSEFRTDTDLEFREVKKSLDFILHKEMKNEREIYYLKSTPAK